MPREGGGVHNCPKTCKGIKKKRKKRSLDRKAICKPRDQPCAPLVNEQEEKERK